jgi:hypothetical protein
MFDIYLTFTLMYLIFYICGYPLKVLFLRDELRKFDLYITPWFGIGLVICALYPLSWLGFSVQSVAAYFFLAVLLACGALWLKYRERVHFTRNDVIFLVSLALIAGAVYGFKLAQDPESYVITLNVDYGGYLNLARAALISSAKYIATLPKGVPYIDQINWYLNIEVRECVFVQAFVAALLNIDLARVTYLLSIFILFLNAAAFRLFFRDFKYISVAIPLAVFMLLNDFYAKFVYMVFLGQLFSAGFTTVAFFLELHLMRRTKFDPVTCIALVFTLTSCGMSYVNGLPVPLLPVLALPVVLIRNKKYDRAHCLKNVAFAGIVFMVVNLWLIIAFVRSLITRNEMQAGFAINMPTFMDIAGLQGMAWSIDGFFVMLLISNAVLIFILALQLRREGLASFISVSFALFLMVHFAVCARYFALGEKSSYYAFKSALSFSFIVYILLLRFFEERLNFIRGSGGKLQGKNHVVSTISSAATMAIFIVTLAVCVKSHQSYAKMLDSRGAAITKSMDVLRDLASDDAFADSDFIINMELSLSSLAAEYFAPFGRSYTVGYGGKQSGARRVMKESFKPGDIYVASSVSDQDFNTVSAARLYANDTLVVYQLDKNSVIQYNYDGISHAFDASLDYGDSEEHIAKRVTRPECNIFYQALNDVTVDISMIFQDLGESPTPKARVYLNGEFVAESHEKDGGQLGVAMKSIILKPGLNRVTVRFFDGEPKDMFLTEIKMGR